MVMGSMTRRTKYNKKYNRRRGYKKIQKLRYKKRGILSAQTMRIIKAGYIPRAMKHYASELITVQSVTTGTGVFAPLTAATTAQYYAFSFALQDLDQVTTFSSLFDQYKFLEVQFCLIPRSNAVDYNAKAVATPANAVNPFMYVVVDRDDSVLPTTIAQLSQYDNCQICNSFTGIEIQLKPSITPSIWAGGVFSGYSISSPKYLDISNTTVPHYGIKVGIQPLQVGSTQVIAWDIQLRYKVSFRNVR